MVDKNLCLILWRATSFKEDLGVAFVDDWVFLVDMVVGNEKG